jgi:hypothetical protein
MNNRIYISGKITGMDEKEAFRIFEDAEKKMKELGYNVINPMKLPHKHDKSWISYMEDDIEALMKCDSIFMLPNWRESNGARIEHQIALCKKMIILYETV